jgi:hypothetical protein
MKVGGGNRKNQRESVRKLVIKHGRKEKSKSNRMKPAQGARGMGKGQRGDAEDEALSIDGKGQVVCTRVASKLALMNVHLLWVRSRGPGESGRSLVRCCAEACLCIQTACSMTQWHVGNHQCVDGRAERVW